jgi:hypothetical protein
MSALRLLVQAGSGHNQGTPGDIGTLFLLVYRHFSLFALYVFVKKKPYPVRDKA